MINSRDIRISQDGKIFINGNCKGFIDDETVYVFERGQSRPIGSVDHRNEVAALVLEWANGTR